MYIRQFANDDCVLYYVFGNTHLTWEVDEGNCYISSASMDWRGKQIPMLPYTITENQLEKVLVLV